MRRLAAAARAGVITHSEAGNALGLSPRETTLRLYSLVRRRWVQRIRRGIFLILPLEAETGIRPTVEDPWILATELFVPSYIGGWSAAEHWGLTEQIFRSTFVATSGRTRGTDVRVQGMEFHVVKVQPRRVETVQPIWRGKERVRVSSVERTIADGLAAPSWLGGIRALVDVLTTYRNSERWSPDRLLKELESVGIGAAFQRLGYIAETLELADVALIDSVRKRRASGVVKLDPGIPSRGRLNKRWGIWINASIVQPEST